MRAVADDGGQRWRHQETKADYSVGGGMWSLNNEMMCQKKVTDESHTGHKDRRTG